LVLHPSAAILLAALRQLVGLDRARRSTPRSRNALFVSLVMIVVPVTAGALARRSPNVGQRHGSAAAPATTRSIGSGPLRARKLRLTGRDDVEMTAAGILYGRGHLDNAQCSALAWLTLLLRQVADAMGRSVPPSAVWAAITGALTRTAPGIEPIIGDLGGRAQLQRVLARLDGSRDLMLELAAEGPLPPICVRAVEHRLTPRDLVQLELLRRGLDGISPPSRTAEDD
jgi:hypothetical protein